MRKTLCDRQVSTNGTVWSGCLLYAGGAVCYRARSCKIVKVSKDILSQMPCTWDPPALWALRQKVAAHLHTVHLLEVECWRYMGNAVYRHWAAAIHTGSWSSSEP